ncbi:MAG: hypothetical protein ACLRL6_17755 [Clostridium sp.]
MLNDGYCDGGIRDYFVYNSNEYTLNHLHVALAHETNHNAVSIYQVEK